MPGQRSGAATPKLVSFYIVAVAIGLRTEKHHDYTNRTKPTGVIAYGTNDGTVN